MHGVLFIIQHKAIQKDNAVKSETCDNKHALDTLEIKNHIQRKSDTSSSPYQENLLTVHKWIT
ncbi:MAG TPA: hypothetical protein DDY75_03715 [Sphingobacterium sp.]|uniref:Uncharacterized protein n=1 Tax=Sphingobacterium multivorum TaxID=28454 RepID=A0A653Y258_SPHMU|nr:conserved hypothetical protein [Sphingobacterium multivorum]HAK27821.1 hypothetical protein [Sphingobacterium sp.]HBI86979.1 hypothetical protein [Sphingobacterium sp.]